jgi:hypothetical protein
MRLLLIVLVTSLMGCGVSVTPNAEPVDVTVEVTSRGKPVDDVTFNLQPIEDGLQASVEVADGSFSAKVTPGRYTYFVSQGKSEATLKQIPEQFLRGSLDRSVEIRESTSLEVALD